MKKVPSALKWLAETRARTAGRIAGCNQAPNSASSSFSQAVSGLAVMARVVTAHGQVREKLAHQSDCSTRPSRVTYI